MKAKEALLEAIGAVAVTIVKSEVNNYFMSLKSCGIIDYIAYSELYDACMPILEECYDRMEKEEQEEEGETE